MARVYTRRAVDQRFWEKVDHNGPKQFHMKDQCWVWLGGINPVTGYGQFFDSSNGKMTTAHRMSYVLANGNIGKNLSVCHHCDYKSCVRPTHLFAGTRSDNMRDAAAKKRLATQRPGVARRHILKAHQNNPWMSKGERNGNAKLTQADVDLVRKHATGKRGDGVRLATMFEVSPSTIGRILKGTIWPANT